MSVNVTRDNVCGALAMGVVWFGAVDLALGVTRFASQARVPVYTYVQGPIWLWALLRCLVGLALIASAFRPPWPKWTLLAGAVFWAAYSSMIAEAVTLPSVTISAPATEIALGMFHLIFLYVYARVDQEQ